jgi:hypothetical protein
MNDTLNERFGRDQLIVHIGVLVAAADRTDPRYGACSRLLTNEPQPLVTTAMLRRRMCSTGNSGRAPRHCLYLCSTVTSRQALFVIAPANPDRSRPTSAIGSS